MKRIPRPLVVAAAVLSLAGLTGCMELSEQTTTLQYTPTDGTQADLDGGVKVRNVLLVSEGSGEPATLIASVVNTGTEQATVNFGGDVVNTVVRVDAGETVHVGPEGDEQVEVDSLDAHPGELVDVTVDAGGEPQQMDVPVMDGTLQELATLVPTASPTTS